MMKTNWLSRLLQGWGFRGGAANGAGQGGASSGDAEYVKMLVRGIVTTRSDEIDCDECFEQVDRFTEMVLDGRDAAEALPLVEDHLERCKDCREEFEALMTALRAMS
jgi:hypothetical protein